MRACACHFAVVQNDDDVGIAHGGDALGDDDFGGACKALFEVFPHFGVRCEVERGEAVVKEHIGRPGGNGAGDGEALALPAREVAAALRDLCLQAPLFRDELCGTGGVGCRHEGFVRKRRVGEGEIFADGARKKRALLRGVAEVAAELLLRDVLNVHAAHEDFARVGIEKAQKEL